MYVYQFVCGVSTTPIDIEKKMMTECRGGGDPYSYSPPACIIFKDMWSKMI